MWNLLPDSLMWSGLIEVLDIRMKDTLQLFLLEDEQVIETLSPHAAQEALTDRIGTWGVIRCFQDRDVTRLSNPREGHAKLAIVITDEVLRTHAIGGGLPQLLHGPRIGGRSCDADVDHSARVQFDDEEGEERTEEKVRDRKEVARPDLLGMGVQERLPGLPTWPGGTHGPHVLLYCALADVDAELEEFTTNPLCPPQAIVPCHLLDQGHGLLG